MLHWQAGGFLLVLHRGPQLAGALQGILSFSALSCFFIVVVVVLVVGDRVSLCSLWLTWNSLFSQTQICLLLGLNVCTAAFLYF